MQPLRILHITAHLGGGVGKVLSRLVEASARVGDSIRHTVVCLEPLQKDQFAAHVQGHGGELLVHPLWEELDRRIRQADIVQLEWWHHPIMARWLCSGELPPMRLVVWSHVSGLHPPEIPLGFLTTPHRFLFTSPCSLEHPCMADLSPKQRLRIKVVFSSGGFDDLPEPAERTENDPLQVGYVGTLNFAKLHPQLLDFVAAVNLPSFRLALVGDPIPSSELLAGAAARGLSDRLDIRGYTMDVVAELTKFNVFAYLLNPLHYGTTENALLEAMAMGVVPIVLDNLAERHLVSHGETGLVVDSPRTFARALTYLSEYPNARKRLSLNASRDVRERFSVRRTAVHLETHYREILGEAKKSFDFRPVFGERPSDWFRACQGEQAWRFKDDDDPSDQERKNGENPHYLYAKTKGSVFHYRSIYPDDERLQRWSRRLEAAR